MIKKFEEMGIKVDNNLKITDIPEYFDANGCLGSSITLLTPNGDYIELYDDGNWEFFKVED